LLLEIETCVEGMKSSQVAAIIEKYVKDHPEKWNWDLKDTGYNAMLDSFEADSCILQERCLEDGQTKLRESFVSLVEGYPFNVYQHRCPP
jgi:hypothetical protein